MDFDHVDVNLAGISAKGEVNGMRRLVHCELEVTCEEVPEGSSPSGDARVGERFGQSTNGATSNCCTDFVTIDLDRAEDDRPEATLGWGRQRAISLEQSGRDHRLTVFACHFPVTPNQPYSYHR